MFQSPIRNISMDYRSSNNAKNSERFGYSKASKFRWADAKCWCIPNWRHTFGTKWTRPKYCQWWTASMFKPQCCYLQCERASYTKHHFSFWACLCGSLPFKRSQCMRVHYICVRTGRTLLDNIRVCCAVFFYFLRIVRVTAAKAKCKCRCRVTRETRFTHKTPQNRKQLRKNSF